MGLPITKEEADYIKELIQRAELDTNGENGNGQSLRIRIGKMLNIQMKMKWAIPLATGILSVMGFGSYVYTNGGVPSAVADASWVAKMNRHVDVEAPQGFKRLDSVIEDVGELRTEMREYRKDQLEQYKWQAEQVKDFIRSREIDNRIKVLNGKK